MGRYIFQTCMLNLILFSLLIFTACSESSVNLENYNSCHPLQEKERQKSRETNDFSYSSGAFDECRAPARYRMEQE